MQKKDKKPKITLREYLDSTGIKHHFFAKEIGVQPNQLSRIIAGGYIPTLKMAIDIEKYTKGKISVYDWDLTKIAHCVKTEANNDQENGQSDT
jgi:plasmid maintenance system antidote protein VapI